MEMPYIVDNLLESIDWGAAALNSYTNFHVKGLSYLNLLRSERLTIKLYVFDQVPHNKQGFLVHPHTHGYNFTHRTLCGRICNHVFSLGEGERWDRYLFDTPLNGGGGVTNEGESCGLRPTGSVILGPDFGYYMTIDEVHTLSVNTRYAAAVLCQFHDVNVGKPTHMFVPCHETPDCETDLYHRMHSWEGRLLVERYREERNAAI